MNKFITIFTAFIGLVSTNANAQMPYKVTVQSRAYAPLTSATSVNGATAWTDTTDFSVPIGFSFKLGDKTISKLSMLDINTVATDTTGTVSGMFFIGTALIDRGIMNGISQSPIRYATSGATGKRIFKLELLNAGFADENNNYATLNDSLNVQIWLYEDSNIVEMHYGSAKISHASEYFFTGGPMIGFMKNGIYANQSFEKLYLLKGNPLSPTIDSATSASGPFPGLASYPSNGTVYRFTPKSSSVVTEIIGRNTSLGLKVYPTLASDKLYVDNNNSKTISYRIVSLTGNVLQSGTLTGGRNTLDLSAMPMANYVLAAKSDEGTEAYHFIKQ